MKINQTIRLIPVLELDPTSFSKGERVSPEKSKSEAPQEWQNYNQLCYSDSLLNNIQPIRSLSWLFEIERLTDDNLEIVLRNLIETAVQDFNSINEILDDPIEYAPLFPGGYLFEVNKLVKSEPGCCCGLEDISEWKDSDTVLTGHGNDDFVHIIKNKSEVTITIKNEIFILSIKDYNKIVNDAEIMIEEFIERSGKLINGILKIESGVSFARAMIYKWS